MSKNGQESRSKVFFAKLFYRWGMAQGIVGVLFSAMTWAGVFTLLLGPVFQQWGIGYSSTLFVLLGMVAITFLGLGFVLDRVVRFWTAQALVSTTRNPFLISRLYEKEMLSMKTEKIPEMIAIRALLAASGEHSELVSMLDKSIERLTRTVENKQWTIEPGEDVYQDST